MLQILEAEICVFYRLYELKVEKDVSESQWFEMCMSSGSKTPKTYLIVLWMVFWSIEIFHVKISKYSNFHLKFSKKSFLTYPAFKGQNKGDTGFFEAWKESLQYSMYPLNYILNILGENCKVFSSNCMFSLYPLLWMMSKVHNIPKSICGIVKSIHVNSWNLKMK